jgi:hypothetical protein
VEPGAYGPALQPAREARPAESLDDDAFRRALRDKRVEEARDAADANDGDLATELADLQEVIDALLQMYGPTARRSR